MNTEDLKLKFIRKWTSLLNEEEVVTDLDELLEAKSKEVAKDAYKEGLLVNAEDGELFEDGAEADFEDWHSNYKQQSHE